MVKKSMPVDKNAAVKSTVVKSAVVEKWQSYLAILQDKLQAVVNTLAVWAGKETAVLPQLVCATKGRYLRSCYIVFRVHDHYELIHIEENRQSKPPADDGLNEGTVELFSELLSLESDWISQQQMREGGNKKSDS
ncbi:hypothetical protein EOPP23_16500 [Endozoicomonas sp. OPT23]|uniref:hypothetical protein n=1 Tax=Endozoicomonas sp. OPT23 TaxID=2072845 RepID=UPI00129A44A9|nr:hypothetical protein [Endozoicomonas sp. OPT23]MRI34587.1 hypothetical protein [Endozoicomonas sp. OPT23]